MLGVLNMLQKLLKEEDPPLIAVVFDASGRTFRDDLYVEYKANRPAMEDDLRAQVDPLIETVTALGLPSAAHRRASRPTTSSARWRSTPPRPDSTS